MERSTLVVAVAPAFAAFLSSREPPAKAVRLTREGLNAAFTRAIAALAAVTPVVMIVEDLEWADAEGLDLFGQIARLAAEMPLLLIGTFRPVAKAAPLAQLLGSLRAVDHVSTSRIDPFTPEETRESVLCLLVPDERSIALAARVHTASEGVPLRVVETIRLLEAEGVL